MGNNNSEKFLKQKTDVQKVRRNIGKNQYSLEVFSADECNKKDLNLKEIVSDKDIEQIVSVIIEVSQIGYVPPRVEVRTWIDSNLFTGEVKVGDLLKVHEDPLVVAISSARQLDIINSAT